MKRIEPTDESFVFPDTFDAETYFADAFGVIVVPEELNVETIRLKISEARNKRKYFRSLPLHTSQNEVEHYTDYSVFEYRLYPTYDFFQEVLSHDPHNYLYYKIISFEEHFFNIFLFFFKFF